MTRCSEFRVCQEFVCVSLSLRERLSLPVSLTHVGCQGGRVGEGEAPAFAGPGVFTVGLKP